MIRFRLKWGDPSRLGHGWRGDQMYRELCRPWSVPRVKVLARLEMERVVLVLDKLGLRL